MDSTDALGVIPIENPDSKIGFDISEENGDFESDYKHNASGTYSVWLRKRKWSTDLDLSSYLDICLSGSSIPIPSRSLIQHLSDSDHDYQKIEHIEKVLTKKELFFQNTASKYSPESYLEIFTPKSPPVLSGEGARIFLEELEMKKYSKEVKEFYKKPVKFDISGIEDIL